MISFITSLKFIFKPAYWVMVWDYSYEWDKALNELLSKHDFENIGDYTAKLGPIEIWIGNHPYASFSPRYIKCRPKRLTIEKAMDKLVKDALSSGILKV